MDFVFIGHQSWLVSLADSHLLIDPVLESTFGHSRNANFRVFPPRVVDVDRMPRPTAIVLSHEHLDHFHLPSLARLPRDVPFYVGPVMPEPVVRAIRALGFNVTRLRHGEPCLVGALELTLFVGAPETVFWERRVSQFYVRAREDERDAVFIAVDALISEQFLARLEAGDLAAPTSIIMSNNSQVPPPGAVGAHSNLLPLPATRTDPRFPGLSVLHSNFVEQLERLHDVRNIILCGNGFVSLGEAYGPFLFSDNKVLAAMANELGTLGRAYGLYPGESLLQRDGRLEEAPVDWIRLDRDAFADLLERQGRFVAEREKSRFVSVLPPLTSEGDVASARELVERELETLAGSLLRSPVGLHALSVEEHLRGPVGPRRVLFRFVVDATGRALQYAFDINESRFVPDATPVADILEVFPFGVQFYLGDFASILRGELQIWDIAGSAMRSWFMGSIYENIPAFLLEYYGEQARPDLAWRVYRRCLDHLGAA